MAKRPQLVRKKVMLDEAKVKRLVRIIGARSQSEAIRIAIDDALFALSPGTQTDERDGDVITQTL